MYRASFALLLACTFSLASFAAEISTIAGTGKDEFSGDGGLALQAGLGQPFGFAVGPDGALYWCEFSNHVIRRLDLKTNQLATVAGMGRKAGYTGDQGPATKATLNQPHEVQFDAAGNYFISDMLSHAIRRVDAQTGEMTTLAGTGQAGFAGDGGPAAAAQFNLPISVLLHPTAGLLVCDIKNHRVRQIDLKTGIIATLAGTGVAQATPPGAPLTGSPLNGPRTLAQDAQGRLIIVLREGNAVYRADIKANTLEHLAGTGKQGYAGDGGDAKLAWLNGPKGVAVDSAGNILLCDTENHSIRVIWAASGKIETLVGDGKKGDGPEGDPRMCRLNRPHGILVDATGDIYIGDSQNHKVRKLHLP